MSDAREALVQIIAGSEWDWRNITPERIADAILAAGWTPPGERVKPSVEDVAQAIREQIEADEALLPVRAAAIFWPDVHAAARRVLALLPGRTEAEVKAEALRKAAPGCNCEDDYAWLNDRAARIEKGEGRG